MYDKEELMMSLFHLAIIKNLMYAVQMVYYLLAILEWFARFLIS